MAFLSRAAALVAVVVLLVACHPAPTQGAAPSPTNSPSATAGASPSHDAIDPFSGLPWVDPADLPPEARTTMDLIKSHGPFPHSQDGVVFENREGILPEESTGYHHEYTVETPGSADRGARRIVTGSNGEMYYTDDHYDSFERIRDD